MRWSQSHDQASSRWSNDSKGLQPGPVQKAEELSQSSVEARIDQLALCVKRHQASPKDPESLEENKEPEEQEEWAWSNGWQSLSATNDEPRKAAKDPRKEKELRQRYVIGFFSNDCERKKGRKPDLPHWEESKSQKPDPSLDDPQTEATSIWGGINQWGIGFWNHSLTRGDRRRGRRAEDYSF